MDILQKLLMQQPKIEQAITTIATGEAQDELITGLIGSAKSAFIDTLYRTAERPIYMIVPTMLYAQRTVNELTRIVGEDEVFYYPADDFIAADVATTSHELRAERIATLDRMIRGVKGVYVLPVDAFRRVMAPKEQWATYYLAAEIGTEITITDWLLKLVVMGYRRSDMVTTPGEFSVRGGILDIYPPYMESPVRIELFDTEVDSIRTFSADDQRSIERLEQIKILPASEVVLPIEQRKAVAVRLQKALEESLQIVKNEETKQLLEKNISADIALLATGELPQYIMKYGSLLYEEEHYLESYFAADGIVIGDEMIRIQETMNVWRTEEENWYVEMIEEGKLVHAVKNSRTLRMLMKNIAQQKLYTSVFARTFGGIPIKRTTSFSCKPGQEFRGQMAMLQGEIARWKKANYTVLFVAQGQERLHKMKALLEDYQIIATLGMPTAPGIYLVNSTLSTGFEFPLEHIAVVTDDELFKQPAKRKVRAQKMTNAERIKSYADMKPGDYVVHVHHGIGRYVGMETLEVNGQHKDYLHIRYRGEDKLFVPVDQIDLIQKYVASEDKEPKIHKLGGVEWKKAKARVSAAVKDIADELIKLYAAREAEKGFSFASDGDEMRSFELAFPYNETDDQLRTIAEVKKDMERERPMDRLVCGDVGYGKTEVAIRAAFKAVLDGKQVAFLVPTTILAQQHYETMLSRFEDFPVKVGLLSRFRTRTQQKETLKELKDGRVDIVVGTHRVLSKDVVYHDLGLLIIDEEQRFGVTHKERIKQLKNNVDVLTLTATPIPRTLHMSMVGVRDLSVIETPPVNRFPIQTYVMEHNGGLIREAIEREMGRGGQVFYLYNRVEDMTRQVDIIQQLVPEARVAYAHGQMTETELEAVMIGFLEEEYDVLVTTTIIETGVDIPNVNTLIVHDADKMGLSQLYQLRGRVGRSSVVAYAYFMYQQDKVLTEVAESRLQAIKEFTDLGSGFKIAMRDLSIRGAGNLLGAQQHGFIDSVGFDLYSQMLEDAIEERQTGEVKAPKIDVEIVLQVDAYIPDTYIGDSYQKIQMYKRIKAMDNVEDYEEITDELIDRFGDLPEETIQLLRIARMKVWCHQAGIASIKERNKKITILFTPEGTSKIDGGKVVQESMQFGKLVGFGMEGTQMIITLDETRARGQNVFAVLEAITELAAKSLK